MSAPGFSPEVVALGIPHLGIPRRDLNRQQRIERANALATLTDSERAAYHRDNGIVHGGKGNATMAAKRTTPVKQPSDLRFLPAGEVRDYWVAELRRLGLDGGFEGQALWRRARALADGEAAALAEAQRTRGEGAAATEVERRIAFHEAEAGRWRNQARLDRDLAEQHDLRADEHEAALADLMFHEGLL